MRRIYQCKKGFKPSVIALAVSQTLFCAPVTTLDAATINVDPPGTPGGCTLIEAINTANSDGPSITCVQGNGPDTINLPANKVFSYSIGIACGFIHDSALPCITSTITVNGNGSTIQRDNAAVGEFRIIEVTSMGNLSLYSTKISGGNTSSGAGILVDLSDEVNITNSTISGNSAGAGVSAYSSGEINITNSTISGNGGIGLLIDGTDANVVNSTITGNNGTGMHTAYHQISITDSTIKGNSGPGLLAIDNQVSVTHSTIERNDTGGVFISGANVDIGGSTISANRRVSGGGLYIVSGSSTSIFNSTISDNTATDSGGGILVSASSEAKIANVTIFNNKVDYVGGVLPDSGGGIYAVSGATLDFDNTVIANSSPTDCGGLMPGTGSGNWFEDTSCSGTAMGDPKLGALDFNGGPTKTHAPLPGSGLEGAGNIFACLNPPVNNLDQRGETRGNPCFIGAVEGIIDPTMFFTIPLPNGKALVIAL